MLENIQLRIGWIWCCDKRALLWKRTI